MSTGTPEETPRFDPHSVSFADPDLTTTPGFSFAPAQAPVDAYICPATTAAGGGSSTVVGAEGALPARQRGGTLGQWSLAAAVLFSVLSAGAVWLAFDSISLSTDPIGDAPQWFAVSGVAWALLLGIVVVAFIGVIRSKARLPSALALVVALVGCPILIGIATTLGVDGVQDRARDKVTHLVNLEQIYTALSEAGVPTAPIRVFLGTEGG